jgi:hypothetical protein
MRATSPLVRVGNQLLAYEGREGFVEHRFYPKNRFSQDTIAVYAAYAVDERRLFLPSPSIISSTDQPAPSN